MEHLLCPHGLPGWHWLVDAGTYLMFAFPAVGYGVYCARGWISGVWEKFVG